MKAEIKFDPGLYFVADRDSLDGRSIRETVAAAVRGGATMVQLRMKSPSTREFILEARALVDLLRGTGVPLIINDRADVALAAGADGLHIGQSDMPPADARKLMGEQAIIGLSVENPTQLTEATGLGLDYMATSPVFPTLTKTDTAPAVGLDGLAAMRRATGLRLVAIGGINASNAARVMAAGADGIAVVSAIGLADDPEAAARSLRAIVETARARR